MGRANLIKGVWVFGLRSVHSAIIKRAPCGNVPVIGCALQRAQMKGTQVHLIPGDGHGKAARLRQFELL